MSEEFDGTVPMGGEQETPNQGAEETVSTERDWVAEAKNSGWDENRSNEIDARSWVTAAPQRKQISTLNRKLRDLEQSVVVQRKIHEKLLATERDRVLKELEGARLNAVKSGDADAFVKAEQQITAKKQEFHVADTQAKAETPGFSSWKEKNDWYEKNEDMKIYADGYGIKLRNEDKSRSPDDILAEVEKKVRSKYPEYFQRSSAHTAVEGAGGNRSAAENNRDLGLDDIPKEIRDVALSQWKAGAFVDKNGQKLSKNAAMKRYAEELRQIGGI